jgi:MFS family permease
MRSFLADLYESFFRSGRGPLFGVVLAILPQGAVALGLALSTTIPVDLGMTEGQIAGLSLLTALASAAGCVGGGWISDRIGHRKSLAVWYALTALPPLFLAWRMWDPRGLAGIDARLFTIVASCFAVASGLQYGTGNAVFMALSSRTVAATQFTGYMALKNLALSYSSFWQGRMASAQGYARTLLIDGLAAVLPILVIPLVGPPRRRGSEALDPAPSDAAF